MIHGLPGLKMMILSGVRKTELNMIRDLPGVMIRGKNTRNAGTFPPRGGFKTLQQ
jgi:hypothetical protein